MVVLNIRVSERKAKDEKYRIEPRRMGMMATMAVRKRNSGMSGGTCQGHAISMETMNKGFRLSKWHVMMTFLLLYTLESKGKPWPISGSL